MGLVAAVVNIGLVATHLVAVNAASAGPLICTWLHRRWRRGDQAAGVVGRRLAWCTVWGLAVGTLVGLVLLAWLWMRDAPEYWQAIERFPLRTFGFAAGELAFTAACLLAYVALWDRWLRRPWLHALIAVAAATNLLYHFPPLMIALSDLSVWPEWISEPVVTRPLFRGLFVRSEFMGQVLHFALASFAVGGVLLMLVSQHSSNEVDGQPSADRLIRAGAGIAIAASLVQLVVGPWLLLALPPTSRNAFIGDDWLASVLFFLSIVAALALLRALCQVVLGDFGRRVVQQSTVLLSLVIVLMVAALARTRHIESLDNEHIRQKIAPAHAPMHGMLP